MFIISQYILHKSNVIPDVLTISTYSVVIGLIVYASIYVYFLMYNKELLPFFNKIVIYIIGVDLLLSSLYYYSIQSTSNTENISPLLIDEIHSESQNYSEVAMNHVHEFDSDSDEDSESTETEIDELIDEYSNENTNEIEPVVNNDVLNTLSNASLLQLPVVEDKQTELNSHNKDVNEEHNEESNVIKKRKRRTKKEIEQDLLQQQQK